MNRQFEKELCDALGLGDRQIKELTIRCNAGEPTTVHTVEFLINPGVSVETISRTFDLVERKEDTTSSIEC
ncbi:hypothetical protein SAMN05216420_101386 [Nitrosospira sp. Nl5]|nr:hypothetical protein SAMN05216420_101386 [Nitrosospira sp. Nl5]